MNVSTVPLTTTRGDTPTFYITVRRGDKLEDITGAAIVMTARRAVGDATPIFTRAGSVISGTAGTARVSLLSSDTEPLPFQTCACVYDIRVKLASGELGTVARGTFTVIPDITRSADVVLAEAEPDPTGVPLNSVAWSLWINSQNVSGTVATGQASAGTSGSHNMMLANSVVKSAGLDGIQSIAFNGTSDSMTYLAGGGASDLISPTAWTIVALVKLATIPTSDAANPYQNVSLGTITNANWAIGLSNTGPTVQAYQFDSVNKIATRTFSLGTWTLIIAKYDGTNIRTRIGHASWSAPTAAGAILSVGSVPFRIGVNYSYGQFMTGELLEYFAASSAIDDTTLDGIVDTLSVKYPSLVV